MSGSGDITFFAIIMLALFLMAQWYAARLASVVKLPTIPFEIGVGLIFGPHGFDLIPDFSHDYSPLRLLGFIGVGLIIFESGMHLSIQKVANREIGPHVVVVACLGTALPIVLGILFMNALGSEFYPNGLAAGFALAPTSVGISLTLLSRAKQLNSRNGQIIMSAAFLDDIFSIICLVVLTNLGEGNLNVVNHIIVPLISSFVFVGFGAIGSIYLPKYTPILFDDSIALIQALQAPNRTLSTKDEMQLFYMIASYLMLSWLGNVIGSSLLGGFVAGMLFSTVPRSHLVWEKQFKRINRWLLRIFFSCTVAFSIDIAQLFTLQAFWKGCVIGFVPCLLTKIMSGVFTGDGRWVVGIAMMARGEFAYLVAETGHDLEMLTSAEYAVVVWALLWATIVAPFAFDKVLKKFVEQQYVKSGGARSSRIGGDKFSGEQKFIIRYFGILVTGMVREVTEGLHALGFDVDRSHTEVSGGFGMGTFEVFPRQAKEYMNKYGDIIGDANSIKTQRYKMATDLTDDKLDEVAHYLKETIGDENAQISFEPSDKTGNCLRILEVKIFGRGHRAHLHAVAELLEESSLIIMESMVVDPDKSSNTNEYSVFYCTKLVMTDDAASKRPQSTKIGSMRRLTAEDLAEKEKETVSRIQSVSENSTLLSKDTLTSVSLTSSMLPATNGNHDQPSVNSVRLQSRALTAPTSPDAVTEEDLRKARIAISELYINQGMSNIDVVTKAIHEDAVIYVGDVDTTYNFDDENIGRDRVESNALRKRSGSGAGEGGGDDVIKLDRRMSGSTIIDVSKRNSAGTINVTRKLTFDPTDVKRLQSSGDLMPFPKGQIPGVKEYSALMLSKEDDDDV